jgi:hypothetical protein
MIVVYPVAQRIPLRAKPKFVSLRAAPAQDV